MIDSGKRNIVYVGPRKPVQEMTDAEIKAMAGLLFDPIGERKDTKE